MTKRSMQEIIQVESELHANEQAEREKAAAWLNNEQASIQTEHQRQLDALEKEKEDIREQARIEGEKQASEIILKATDDAARLDCLDDDRLRRHLEQHLAAIITGKFL